MQNSYSYGLGFQEKDAKRALRLNNQDIASSIDFLIEEKAKRDQKRKDDLQRQEEILEQKKYGVTPMKKAVDMQMLDRLVSIGYARDLAAESFRRNENDFQKALDIITNPEVNSKIQAYIVSRKRKRQEQEVGVSVDELVSMGFERGNVTTALEAGGNREDVIQRLLSVAEANPSSITNKDSSGVGAQESTSNAIDSGAELDAEMKDETTDEIENQGSTSSDGGEERDTEIEGEIEKEIAEVDTLWAYYINLDREIKAINEYLSMLDSTQQKKVVE